MAQPNMKHVLISQLKASLAEQLSVEQLRTEFRGYIETKVAQELVDFYLDSLDREEVAGFFKRQVCRRLSHVPTDIIVVKATSRQGYQPPSVPSRAVPFFLGRFPRRSCRVPCPPICTSQAVTMRIVERYIREGSPEQV